VHLLAHQLHVVLDLGIGERLIAHAGRARRDG
jgi:hypothetical protein